MEQILKKHRLSLILLHGSQVDGKTHSKSDIDIAVSRKAAKDDLDLLALYADLSKFYNSDKLDITNITHANPLLMFTVARKSRLLAGKSDDYEAFQRKAFHRYNNYKKYFKMESDFIKERINSYGNS